MSKRRQVLLAVKALLEATFAGVTVLGLEPEDVKPERIPDGGLAWLEAGDPGPADIDLSPPTYHYEHDIPVMLAFNGIRGSDVRNVMDTRVAALGVAIATDRHLGGLCDYLDASAPTEADVDKRGTVPVAWIDLTLTASYSTTSPLG